MGILTKEAIVKLTSNNVEYYRNLGYKIPMKKASNSYRKKYHKDFVYDLYNTITVKIEDLPMGSDTKVEVLCDMCKKNKMTVAYGTYNRVVRNTGSYVCKECSHEKNIKQILKNMDFQLLLNLKPYKKR